MNKFLQDAEEVKVKNVSSLTSLSKCWRLMGFSFPMQTFVSFHLTIHYLLIVNLLYGYKIINFNKMWYFLFCVVFRREDVYNYNFSFQIKLSGIDITCFVYNNGIYSMTFTNTLISEKITLLIIFCLSDAVKPMRKEYHKI